MATCTEVAPVADTTCSSIEPVYLHTIPDVEVPKKDPSIEMLDIFAIFDKMMIRVRTQLDIDFKMGRIKGADYTAKIAEMIPIMMDTAAKYAIGYSKSRMEAEKLQYEITLAGEKAALEMTLLYAEVAASEAKTFLTKAQVVETQEKAALACTQNNELSANGKSKRAIEAKELCLKESMIDLYSQQASSFADKGRNDTFKTISNMWTVFISEVYQGPEGTPAVLSGTGMDQLISSMRGNVGV